jgi:predicted RNA-binding protein with PUA-like domain
VEGIGGARYLSAIAGTEAEKISLSRRTASLRQPWRMKQRHWLVKQEPSAYSWDDFVKDGRTAWTGVRNFQARNNLKAMRKGDRVLYYHSVIDKAVIGIAEVAREAYRDPTASEGDWVCVDLVPVRVLARAVPLDEIKAEPKLAGMALIKQSRLSVIPLTKSEFDLILKIAAR